MNGLSDDDPPNAAALVAFVGAEALAGRHCRVVDPVWVVLDRGVHVFTKVALPGERAAGEKQESEGHHPGPSSDGKCRWILADPLGARPRRRLRTIAQAQSCSRQKRRRGRGAGTRLRAHAKLYAGDYVHRYQVHEPATPAVHRPICHNSNCSWRCWPGWKASLTFEPNQNQVQEALPQALAQKCLGIQDHVVESFCK